MKHNIYSHEEIKKKVINLRKNDTSKPVIAQLLSVRYSTVTDILKEAGMNENYKRSAPPYFPPGIGRN